MVANPAIEASNATRLCNDIPSPNAVFEERIETRRIVHVYQIAFDHLAHEMPESVGVLVNLTPARHPPGVKCDGRPLSKRAPDLTANLH